MTKHPLDEAGRGFPAGTLIDDRYRVVRLISQGSLSRLHEVEHARTGRRLALKTPRHKEDGAQIESEARAAGLMKNPHAVKVVDMGVSASAGPYLVMDLVEGQSLRSLLDEKTQLSTALTVNIALQVCECLAEAHEHGLVHCALKPESLLLAPSRVPEHVDVKLVDFGSAAPGRAVRAARPPWYTSPEQLQNAADIDGRADIYALGVVLYECLAGRRPFEAATADALLRAISAGAPAPLSRLRPDAPADVCQATMRALSARRDERQATIGELAAALLPYGDPALGLWMRHLDRPAEASAGPPRARGEAETSAGVDGWAGSRAEHSSPDPEKTDPDARLPDSEPTTTSWSPEEPGAFPHPGMAWAGPSGAGGARGAEQNGSRGPDGEAATGPWPSASQLPGGAHGTPSNQRDSEPPTAAWNNSAVRALVDAEGLASELKGGDAAGPAWRNAGPQPTGVLALRGGGAPNQGPVGGPSWSAGNAQGDAVFAAPSTQAPPSAAFEVTVRTPIATQRLSHDLVREVGRDTPTEMYRKSDLGSTPPRQSEAPFSNTPGAGPPTFGPSPFSRPPMPSEPTEVRSPFSDPPPAEYRGIAETVAENESSMLQPASYTPALGQQPPVDRPGWKRSLDAALVRVGDLIEPLVRWLGRAPLAGRIAFVLFLVLALAAPAVFAYWGLR